MPERLRLSRRHKLPPGSRSVARPHRWGNPFKIGRSYVRVLTESGPRPGAYRDGDPVPGNARVEVCHDVDTAVAWFAAWLDRMPELRADARTELAGKHLACWCRSASKCHADVLLRIANGTEADRG